MVRDQRILDALSSQAKVHMLAEHPELARDTHFQMLKDAHFQIFYHTARDSGPVG